MTTRPIQVTGLFINAKTTRCAHACRYCSIGSKEFTDLPFARFSALVENLLDWRDRIRPDFEIYPVVNDSFEVDHDTKVGLPKLRARAGQVHDVMTTGGLRMRSDNELRDWLAEWKEVGIACVHATYAGYGQIHDRYNGRRGDFDWLVNVQHVAGELGFSLGQSLFLTKSTLPTLLAVIDRLDQLTGERRYRWIFPIAYVGLAARLEEDRIDEAVRDSLPRAFYDPAANWPSEREWLERLADEDAAEVENVTLRLEVSDRNIADLERQSWEQILTDVEKATRAVYDSIPTLAALRREVGDPTNRRIYEDRGEIERLWVDRYLVRNNISVNRKLSPLTVWRPNSGGHLTS